MSIKMNVPVQSTYIFIQSVNTCFILIIHLDLIYFSLIQLQKNQAQTSRSN